jgi:predicted O-methyltransferase YrrM
MSTYDIRTPEIRLKGILGPPGQPLQPLYKGTYEFTKDWFTRHIPVWREILVPFLANRPEPSYFEIGVYEGRSFLWMMETFPDLFLTGIDPWTNMPEVKARFLSNLVASHEDPDRWFIHDQPAQRFLLAACAQQPIDAEDVIYIDGDHRAVPTLEHAVLAFRLLKPGGMLIFDDYPWQPNLPASERPMMAIDFFWEMYKDQVEVVHWSWQVFLRKRG